MSLKTVNIRALKDRLSAFLRDVQHGDIVLITDRGKVVAELRRPTVGQPGDPPGLREQSLVERGVLRIGLPNDPSAYVQPAAARVADDDIDRALAWTRGSETE
jgi:antitoxin (DNA-binding transcriptional repressor) of toxin-antitoxin stability system